MGFDRDDDTIVWSRSERMFSDYAMDICFGFNCACLLEHCLSLARGFMISTPIFSLKAFLISPPNNKKKRDNKKNQGKGIAYSSYKMKMDDGLCHCQFLVLLLLILKNI